MAKVISSFSNNLTYEETSESTGTQWLTKWCFLAFVLSSCYTHSIGDYGSSPILGRMVWADLLGLLVVSAGLWRLKVSLTPITLGCLVFFASLAPGIFVSFAPMSTGLELGILFFLILIYVAASQVLFTHADLWRVSKALALAAIIAAVLGIWENSAHLTGLPRIFSDDIREYRSGSFRNSGQAGVYLLICLSVLIPLRYSSLGDAMTLREKRFFEVAIFLGAISILMTVKIGAYIGITIGGTGFAIYKGKIGFILPVVVILSVFLVSIPWINQQFPTLTNRFVQKTESRLNSKVLTNDRGFIYNNYGMALKAFEDNPMFGTGIMGFHGRYAEHEVHSTPMKLVGETGIAGCLGYLLFVYCFVVTYRRYLNCHRENPYRDYLDLMLPFIVGCAVSWIYTFHMRKREFWILLVIFTLAGKLAERYENDWRPDSDSDSEDIQVH